MVDLFHSPRLTFVRAEQHIHDFKDVANKFIAEKPWTRFVDKVSQPGQDLHKIKFQPLPEMLPCILFDAANNLRAVLDQIGYSSALAAKGPSLKATKFPFGPTEEKWRNNLAGGCKDLPPEIRAIFERCNAYLGGNDPLWAINEIANTNKHLALKPLVVTGPSVFFNARIETEGWISETVSPGGFGIGWDPKENEITLMSVPSAPPDAKTDINANVTFAIVLDGIENLSGKAIIDLLGAARGEVERILLATEAECRNLGFQIE